MKDLHHNLKTVQTLDPAVTTGARSGAPVDRQGFEAVEHIVLFGASGDTLSSALKLEAKLEASENGTDWSAVTDAKAVNGAVSASGVFATVDAAAKAQKEYRVGYAGNARYSRVTLALTGTHTNGTPVSALAVLARAHVKPVV
ncbi:MAG: hypothetical protein K8R18_13235 [Parvibaculum sp.]|uniref:hypothetical protein n=1 Tax=Parvibaculum sp. TaxID=2024848 RepID=UPI0025D9FDB5|nr:hypothetical protein [Parvibaculum sp.]MCE9650580.1 hypothetical protein [Parvibaculum sp.]